MSEAEVVDAEIPVEDQVAEEHLETGDAEALMENEGEGDAPVEEPAEEQPVEEEEEEQPQDGQVEEGDAPVSLEEEAEPVEEEEQGDAAPAEDQEAVSEEAAEGGAADAGDLEGRAQEEEGEGLMSEWGFSAVPADEEGGEPSQQEDPASLGEQQEGEAIDGQDGELAADDDVAPPADDDAEGDVADQTEFAEQQEAGGEGDAVEGDAAVDGQLEEEEGQGGDEMDDYEAQFAAAQAEGDHSGGEEHEGGEGGEYGDDSYAEGGEEEMDEYDDGLSNYDEDSRDLEQDTMFGHVDEDEGEEDEHKRLLEDLHQANEENDHLLRIYKEREKAILQVLSRGDGLTHSSAEEKINSAQIQNQDQMKLQYFKLLEDLNKLWDSLDTKRQDAERRIDRLTVKLDREDEKATELSDAFKKFKREISKEARFSRNGKPLKLKRILAFEDSEAAKDKEVATVRLKHITLVNQVRQLEEKVKQKEELAEGLHMIDFEQLKIENQTLNEKIEERNDDLHKLRKKTTTTVQVLTHIKEKLHFVEKANGVLENEMGDLDSQVTNLQMKLTRAKQQRDSLRSENVKLKQKQGFIGSDLLVGDFEMRKDTLVETRGKVAALKNKHVRMAALVKRARKAEDAYNALMQHQQRPGFHPRDPRAGGRQTTPMFR